MPVTGFSYSIPYLLFLLFLVVLMFLEFRNLKFGKDIKYIRWGVWTGFLFFFGLRGFVFTDWLIYYDFFEKIPSIWDGGLSKVINGDVMQTFESDASVGKAGYELGFVYSTLIFKSIIPNYFIWIFCNVLVDLIFLDIIFRRYSPYYVMSFILFVALGGLIIECNLIRNVKAILFFIFSLKYIQERRIIPYMAINLLGCLFHSSAVVFLPLYFFLHKECPKWLMWSIFVVGNIICLMQISYLKPIMLSFAEIIGGRLGVQIKIYFALDLYSQAYGISVGFIERVFTFLMLIFFQQKLVERNKQNILIINIYILYFVVYFYFSEIMIAVERLTLLFVFSYWLLYPELYAIIKTNVNKLICFMLLVLFCVMKTSLTSSNIFARYDNILFGIENFESRSVTLQNNEDNFLDSRK